MNNNVLMVVIGIIVIIIGFFIYGAVSDKPESVPATSTPSTSASSAEIEAQLEREAAFRAEREAEEAKAQEVAFTIDVTKLPEAQQVALKTMGVNETSIAITNAMVTCAEADMSEARVMEIKNGASVTVSEGITLVGCYNSN